MVHSISVCSEALVATLLAVRERELLNQDWTCAFQDEVTKTQ